MTWSDGEKGLEELLLAVAELEPWEIMDLQALLGCHALVDVWVELLGLSGWMRWEEAENGCLERPWNLPVKRWRSMPDNNLQIAVEEDAGRPLN